MAAERDGSQPAGEGELASRLAELRRMHGEAIRPDGVRRLVRWVARGVGGQAALLDSRDRMLHAFPELRPEVLAAAAEDIEGIRVGRSRGGDSGGGPVSVWPIGPGRDAPVLVVAAAESEAVTELVGDATRLMWLCWQVEQSRRSRQRMDRAEVQAREAVLHMLMVGHRAGASRVAATLGPVLPDPCRMFVVELKPGVRDVVAARLDEVTLGQAWIVRCPVYTGHVMVMAPVADEAGSTAGMEHRIRELAASRYEEIRVGVSEVVSLRDVGTGYEQAFHALTSARNQVERYAVFDPRQELAGLLLPAGPAWARELLAPLLDYVPERPQDPDAAELVLTLGSWLNFHHRAARQLKIHRNTLAARLARLSALLRCDPRDVPTQAMLQLALRLRELPEDRNGGAVRSLDALFGAPAVRLWAEAQLGSLLEGDASELLATLRVWLEHNARLDETAEALGISGPGVRKRLLRIEQLLGRSLLHGPSARYSLYFALRAYDGAGFPPFDRAR